MFSVISYLLPENRQWADNYLAVVWRFVAQITESLQAPEIDAAVVAETFSAHTELEQKRISDNLQAIHYQIDGLDTLHVVIGPGRMENVGILILCNEYVS